MGAILKAAGKGQREVASEATARFPVVGVGASAGGLQAFSALLRGIPGQAAIAVVLVQHLARGRESLLPGLLKQTTTLRVGQVRSGVPIRPGHVYVIPPDKRMSVANGHLMLTPKEQVGLDQSVDHFFRSLAEHYRERAVGVVLSGSARDGAAGIREIKSAGGFTMAQEPTEASMDGMPLAAIATGAVDVVLPVARIAEELVRLAATPSLHQVDGEERPAETSQDTQSLRRIFHLLRRAGGVDFTHYKSLTLMRRIQRRMSLRRVESLEGYLAMLNDNPGEVERLSEDILIHVTSFFREPESFDVLKERIFPALTGERTPDNPLRIWVPGCSSGEEAYSLAIALHQFLGDRAEGIPVQIFGTDVSQKMIDRARAGVYPDVIAGDVGPERLRRFFIKVDGGYRIAKAVRDRCVFARQDVTRDPPFSKLDLVVCRNLLIYLEPSLQAKVIELFHYALRESGFLVLGRSETTGSRADLFSLADKKLKIYRRKPGSTLSELGFNPTMPADPGPGKNERPFRPKQARSDWDVRNEANRLVLDRYGPPGVVVDRELRIVVTQGRTSPYLELPSGDASLDLLKMARPGLLHGLRGAVEKAQSEGVPCRKEGLRLVVDGEVRAINLDVTPLGDESRRHLLVLFEEVAAVKRVGPASSRRAPAADKRGQSEKILRQLEEELEASRQYLQSIIHDREAANEELQSANEEILSSNEELQSTNEELDTAKEELQSTNEELSTLNEELHGRNEELSLVNSDLLNLLASVHIPIVIVSADLKIRRFTPAAEKLLNLIPADVGRPIGHLKPNIHCPDLEAMITEVIDTMTTRERDVTDHHQASYTLRVRPYKNIENRIDGAVLALFETLRGRRKEDDLRVARESAASVVTAMREPVVLLDGDLLLQAANGPFIEAFAAPGDEIVGRSLFGIDHGSWNVPTLRAYLADVLGRRPGADHLAFHAELPGGERRTVVLEARSILPPGTHGSLLMVIVREVNSHADASS